MLPVPANPECHKGPVQRAASNVTPRSGVLILAAACFAAGLCAWCAVGAIVTALSCNRGDSQPAQTWDPLVCTHVWMGWLWITPVVLQIVGSLAWVRWFRQLAALTVGTVCLSVGIFALLEAHGPAVRAPQLGAARLGGLDALPIRLPPVPNLPQRCRAPKEPADAQASPTARTAGSRVRSRPPPPSR